MQLRVLNVEDSERDSRLLLLELRRGGYEPVLKRVDTAGTMAEALDGQMWHIVISDDKMPEFSALAALSLLQEKDLDIPFIVLSGTIGEEKAVALMKAGAHDYLMKDSISRLCPAIERELRDAEVRRQRRTAEEDLKASEEKFAKAFRDSPTLMAITTPEEGEFIEINEAYCRAIGYKQEECLGHNTLELKIWADPEHRNSVVREVQERGHAHDVEANLRTKSGEIITVILSMDFIFPNNRKYLLSVATDITRRKKAEAGLKKSAEQLLTAMRSTIEAMAVTTEIRDPYTAGHQRRVAYLARTIAEELQLPGEQVEGVYMAGAIHDIGKIHIPSEILSKPGALTKMERGLIMTHAESSYDILKNIEFPWPIAQTVLQHHERLDGSGYPAGLQGDRICLEAKILAVADVVEAIASHRPYRPALGIDRALEEISQNRGRLYDPAAVDACLNLFNQKNYRLAEF